MGGTVPHRRSITWHLPSTARMVRRGRHLSASLAPTPCSLGTRMRRSPIWPAAALAAAKPRQTTCLTSACHSSTVGMSLWGLRVQVRAIPTATGRFSFSSQAGAQGDGLWHRPAPGFLSQPASTTTHTAAASKTLGRRGADELFCLQSLRPRASAVRNLRL